jgi:uncharacterized protein YjdB
MNKQLKQRLTRKALPIFVAAAMVFALTPMSAFADWLYTFNNTPATATAVTIGQQITFGGPQPNPSDAYDLNQYYKFTVAEPSELTVDYSVVANENAGFNNGLMIRLYMGNGTEQVRCSDGSTTAQLIKSDSTTSSKSLKYKVMPGTYYIQGYNYDGGSNGYGFATVAAQTMPGDPGGEPNDTQITAKTINVGTSYTGNIMYAGRDEGDGGYDQDQYDFYKFSVPANNTTLRLAIIRANSDLENGYYISLLNESGSPIGSGIDLTKTPSASVDYTIEKAGIYCLKVDGWWGTGYAPTEYTFSLTKTVTPSITLPAKASVDKGKTVRIDRTIVGSKESDYKWTSSNTKVATVSETGVVKGISAGTAVITARSTKASNLYASTQVTVYQPLTKITLNKTKLTLKKGKKFTLKVKKWTPIDVSAKYKKLTYKSSNKKVATVTSKGVIKAKKKGKATITVKASNGKTYKCKVTVK